LTIHYGGHILFLTRQSAVERKGENMSKHTTINIRDELAAQIDARRRYRETRSARAEADLESWYRALRGGLNAARIKLTPDEAFVILQLALESEDLVYYAKTAESFANFVMEAFKLLPLGKKYDEESTVEPDILVEKLRNLGDLSTIALTDWAERAMLSAPDPDIWKELSIFVGKNA
jgi:hypothetical protein